MIQTQTPNGLWSRLVHTSDGSNPIFNFDIAKNRRPVDPWVDSGAFRLQWGPQPN